MVPVSRRASLHCHQMVMMVEPQLASSPLMIDAPVRRMYTDWGLGVVNKQVNIPNRSYGSIRGMFTLCFVHILIL